MFIRRLQVILFLMFLVFSITGCSNDVPERDMTLVDSNRASVSQPINQEWNEDLISLQRQVSLLQEAVAPKSSQKAVETWARGVQTRNGALQFAVLSKELREKQRVNFDNLHWVTGISSPWVDRYDIKNVRRLTDKEWEYQIEFYMSSSTGRAGTSMVLVVVKGDGENWYVSQITSDTDYLFPR